MAETGRRPPPFNPALNETQSANDIQSTETRMRRALGLTTSAGPQVAQQRPEQARQRHRFVQDGGVPVVMMGHKPEPEAAALRDRITALEATLEAERASHAATRRAAQEQHATLQALQTRLAHSELAHSEALEAERRLVRAAQQALADAQATAAQPAAQPARRAKPPEPAAPSPAAPSPAAPSPAAASPAVSKPTVSKFTVSDPAVEPKQTALPLPAAPTRKAAPAPVVEKPRRGRPRINPLPEPKPVRWWTPSFRAKGKG